MSDLQKNNAAQNRENPEPSEGGYPIPLFVFIVITSLVVWSLCYIYFTHQQSPAEFGDRRSMADFVTQTSSGDSIDASKLFANHCAVCHQATGAGVPGAFPPLIDSEWVHGEPQVLVQILLHGIEGDIDVGGTVYNGVMPEFGNSLDDNEIAALATYLRSNFENDADAVDADFVSEQREAFDRTEPWGGEAELKQLIK